MAVVNKFNVNKQQVTLDADIIENMSANDVPYNSSFKYDKNTVGDKLSELEKEVIYDVTTNNNGATFTSLSELLSSENLSTLIPVSVRHGGMSIRFIQSSDNKYMQYRLMADTFSTTESDWQGVDEEPIVGSDNFIKSGGVYKMKVDVFGYEEENTLATVAGSSYTNTLHLKKTILPIPPGSNVRIYLEGTNGTFNGNCVLTSDGFRSKDILINKSVKVTTTEYLTYISVKTNAENVLLNADIKLKIVIFGSLSNKVDEVETTFNSYIQRANNNYNVFSTRGYINFDNTNGKLVLSDALYFLRDRTFLVIESGQYDIDLSIYNSSHIALVIDLNNSLVFKTVASLSNTDLIIATVIRNTNTSILKVVNCVIPYKINGKDNQSDTTTLDSQIQTKAELGDLYPYKDTAIMSDGTAFRVTYYMCTDFLPIDTSDEIKIKGSQATSMQLCVFYKEDGTKISSYKEILAAKGVTINTGSNVQYTIPTSDIPKDAYYIRCSASISEGGYIKNNGLSLSYLATELKAQRDNIINLNILNKASTLESIWKCREQYLRSLFTNGNESEHWYGVEWTEENNPNNVNAINSIGDNELHTTLPIQSKMRRCVVKDNIVQYYLNADNSELKEDGTAAKLDGTDGNVMVEIPEFFYRFEDEIVDNVRILRIKISEQGLTGFIFSPKRYTSAYEATVDRTTNKFASVCTTNFTRSNQEVTIKNQSNYTEGSGYSLGIKPTSLRNGFTANATNYRGGTNNDTFDNANDPTINLNMDAEYHTFARNQLGIPVANVNRTDCRKYADLDNGIFIHQYDTVRILWFLSIIEFKTRNIQNSILGSGAVKYPHYEAYESFFTPLKGISCIPCGVTNSLGNHSGEVYYKMQDVPVGATGYGDKIVYSEWNNVWMPCMSYRGIEHFYGHIYKIVDQLTIKCTFTGNYVEGHEENSTWGIYNIDYYYTKNPYFCNDKVSQDKLLSSVTFASCIRTISSILGTSQGHILPIKTDENDLGYDYNYCDCCEISNTHGIIYPTFNGRIVSNKLVGSNFIVGADTITLGTTRPSDGTRIDMFI